MNTVQFHRIINDVIGKCAFDDHPVETTMLRVASSAEFQFHDSGLQKIDDLFPDTWLLIVVKPSRLKYIFASCRAQMYRHDTA